MSSRPNPQVSRRRHVSRQTAFPSDDQRSHRLALWAIGAGLVGALIAGGAGVAGSVVGATMQQAGNQTQADREFTRTQRLNVYMDFIQAWDAYDDARAKTFAAVLALVADRSPYNELVYSNALDNEYLEGTKVSHLITKIALVGSVEAHDAAMGLWDAMKAAQEARGGAQDRGEVFTISKIYRQAASEAHEAFYEAAKRDVSGTLTS